MKQRPILFSAPMVRALLDGSKTQTRRAVKVQPPANTQQISTWHHPDDDDGRGPRFYAWADDPGDLHINAEWCYPCPYGQPGDRLWVRETWAEHPEYPRRAVYRADPECEFDAPRWTPAIHMFRWASRITLEVTGVRVERLQDISEEEAKSEGCEIAAETTDDDERLSIECGYFPPSSYEHGFRLLWEQINGAGSWAANAWVWVVEFRRIL